MLLLQWFWYRAEDRQQETGTFPVWEMGNSIDAYMDELNIDEAMTSSDYSVSLFAGIDRRVGRRCLHQLAGAMESEPEWLCFFYRLRLEAEDFEQ